TTKLFNNRQITEVYGKKTAKEIIDICGERLDAVVVVVGTGGTATGTGEVIKEKIKSVKLFAVEPAESPIFSGGKAGPHKIQGIGAAFLPAIFNKDLVAPFIPVSVDYAVH